MIDQGSKEGVTGALGVSRENENGKKVIDYCEEKGVCISDIFFNHMSNHKVLKVDVGRDGIEVKGMNAFPLVKKMLKYVMDYKLVKGLRKGISGHY